MALVLHRDEVKELFKDPTIKFFNDNQARYFTCWTFFLQWLYAIVGLCCDWLELKNSHNKGYQINKHLRRFRDTLFAAILWPSTLLVSSLFWGLYNFDRELILPPKLDQVLSWTSNHIIHTAIVPVTLWELVTRPRSEPRSHWRNLAHIVFHFVLYFSVVFHTYFTTGVWIYPIFKKTWGTVLFPIFLTAVFIVLMVYYYIQWPLTRLIHGNVDVKKKK
ncbi:FAR-17a/AIG1-like protein domain-containing protein [Phthorimaea operculella]|nr:FAR-17a/AIG1-like protein domain-containing protein [Phthorimaea operculella]